MEIHREIWEKFYNPSYSITITQNRENRLALPEHLLTPINLNIVIRSFPHHNPIFREVVNQFELNAITMLFSAAVCGRNCREKALDETVPFNPSKRARQWMAASLSIHQRELVNGLNQALPLGQAPSLPMTERLSDRTIPTLRRAPHNSPPCSTQLSAVLHTTLRRTLMQVGRRVSSSKAESLSEQGGESRRAGRRAAARPSSDRRRNDVGTEPARIGRRCSTEATLRQTEHEQQVSR